MKCLHSYDENYRTAMSVTTNVNVASPGISGGDPRFPYPSFGGTTSFRRSPTRIPSTPWSHPLITSPAPIVKPNASEASNSVPSDSDDDGRRPFHRSKRRRGGVERRQLKLKGVEVCRD